ncbi:hypothetical protein ACJX0J_023160 [Zea mays]
MHFSLQMIGNHMLKEGNRAIVIDELASVRDLPVIFLSDHISLSIKAKESNFVMLLSSNWSKLAADFGKNHINFLHESYNTHFVYKPHIYLGCTDNIINYKRLLSDISYLRRSSLDAETFVI